MDSDATMLQMAQLKRDLWAANLAATKARNKYANGSPDGQVPPYLAAIGDDEYRFWANEAMRLSAVITGLAAANAEIARLTTRERR